MNILKKALESDNTPNIILHGIKSSGKKRNLYNILNTIYPYSKKIKITNKDLNYYKNNIYYIFNASSITNKNINLFLNTIDEIIKTENHFSKISHKIIIFENFNTIKLTIQNILRVKIEKYRITTVFIIITTNIDSILQPLKSRCLCIRNPSLTNQEKRKFIRSKLENKNYNVDFYDKIYEINDLNILSLISENKNIIDMGFERPYELICKRIINLYKYKYNENIHNKIREISYNILKYNLFIPLFYKVFLDQLLTNSQITDNKKSKLIILFANSQYNFIKSYRSIIIIESLLFNTYALLSDALLSDALLTS